MALAKMKLGARLPSIARRRLGRHSLALALFAVPLEMRWCTLLAGTATEATMPPAHRLHLKALTLKTREGIFWSGTSLPVSRSCEGESATNRGRGRGGALAAAQLVGAC